MTNRFTKKELADLRIEAYKLANMNSSPTAMPEYIINKAEVIFKWLQTGESSYQE